MPDHPMPPPPRAEAAAPAAPPRRRGRILLAVLVLVLGLLGVGWLLRAEIAARLPGGAQAPAPVAAPAEPPVTLTVGVATATPRALARRIAGDGSVVAWQELVLGAEAGGLRVTEVLVDEGSAVRAGQTLVRMDDALLAAQLGQFTAAVVEADAALRIARQDLARAVDLARTQSTPRQTLEQREATTAQAEARLASAQARREEAVAKLAQARILAPADGIVSRRVALPGAVTQPGQEMLRIIRDGRVELDARVPELDLAAIRPGQPVRVIHGDRTVPGEVRAIAPTVAAETRLGIVHVALPPDAGLRPGMFARAEILPGEAPALTVPQSAVLFREGRPAVLVLQGDRVAQRPVSTGRRQDGLVEITQGLAAGEQVVVSGGGFLADGDRVRVAAAPVAAR